MSINIIKNELLNWDKWVYNCWNFTAVLSHLQELIQNSGSSEKKGVVKSSIKTNF